MELRCVLLPLCAGFLALAQQQAPDPAFVEPPDVPGLSRVLLIGDSISIGYTPAVRELLRGKANVHRIPINGGPTTTGIQNLENWLGGGHWDVIHFNFGLHDLKLMEDSKHQVELPEYERNLRSMVAMMKKTGAVLIWASTTPVPEGKQEPRRATSDVIGYNEAARRVMDDAGVPIDDLYAIALPHLAEWQRPANVHFTPEGYRKLAEAVSSRIARELRQP